jgi:hypothetical protein
LIDQRLRVGEASEVKAVQPWKTAPTNGLQNVCLASQPERVPLLQKNPFWAISEKAQHCHSFGGFHTPYPANAPVLVTDRHRIHFFVLGLLVLA